MRYLVTLLLLAGGIACSSSSKKPAQDASLDQAAEMSTDMGPDKGTLPADIWALPAEGMVKEDTSADGASARVGLPLLDPGQHLGMIVSFETLPAATVAASGRDWTEAISKGMSVARVHLDWADLEPKAGQYDKKRLEDALSSFQQQGLQSFVGIYVIDTFEDTLLPADLVGKALDDPLVIKRYGELLDWVVPMVVSKGGFVLSVGNEPDGQLLTDGSLVGPLTRFVAAARKHVKSIDLRLALTITLTQDSTREPHGPLLIAETDVATFNYYPIDYDTMTVTDTGPVAVRAAFDAMLKAADGRPVLLQELGCPAGPPSGPSKMNTSNAKQVEFINSAVAAMRSDARLRAAFWFQQVDWSPALARLIAKPMAQAGMPTAWVDAFIEWFETSGIIFYADGAKRYASWDAFLNAQTALKSDRQP